MEEPLHSRPQEVIEEGQHVPLQLHAQREEGGSIAFTCVNLGGESLKSFEGWDPEETGEKLASRIHSEVPAPPSSRWKIVLPRGECLRDSDGVIALCQLFWGTEPVNVVSKTAKKILLLLGPLLFANILRQIQSLETSIVIGRKGTGLLAAVAVSNQWTSLTDAILQEGQGQLSTLCGPAFYAGNYPLVATWLQTYLVYITVATIPVAALRFLAAPCLKLGGVSDEIADEAGIYTIFTIGALFLDLWAGAVREYYCSQKIVVPDVIVDFIFVFLILITLWFFIIYLDAGIMGAAMATTVSRAFRLALYITINWCFGNHKKTWHSWSAKEIFRKDRWKQIMKLTLPAGLSGIAEQLQMTICVALVTHLGSACTAAFSLGMNVINIFFSVASSSAEATGIVMNAAIGANQPKRARFTAWTGIGGVVLLSVTLSGLLLGVGWKYFVLIATEDPDVRAKLNQLQYLIMGVVMVLGNAMLLFGLMAKQGRAAVATFAVVSGCWGVGLPISIAYQHTLAGVMGGLATGYAVGSMVLLVIFLRTDWKAVTKRARTERAEIRSRSGTEEDAAAPAVEGGGADVNPYHTMSAS